MPASHRQASAPLAPRSAFGALRAFTEGAARLWARHESLGCLLFAVDATLAVALVERASGATWHAVAPLCVGSSDPGDYAVEWLLLSLALGVAALLHAELGSLLPPPLKQGAAAAMRVGFDAAWAGRAKAV